MQRERLQTAALQQQATSVSTTGQRC